MQSSNVHGGVRSPHKILVIGLGLLGGSVALAARRRGLASRIVALARPGRDHRDAVEAGLVDGWTNDLAGAMAECDFVLMASPVDAIRESLPTVLAAARPGTLVTDVGSTKWRLVEAAEACPTQADFVGSHPMAGSHLTGWRHSREDLFEGSTTYVTPTEHTNREAMARVSEFWRVLGSRIVITHPRRHDELAALVSHVPHMTAVALVELINDSGEDPHFLRHVAGPGFRDATRIAMGSPAVWSEICAHNAQPVADRLRRLAALLGEVAAMVENGETDELTALLDRAAKVRQGF